MASPIENDPIDITAHIKVIQEKVPMVSKACGPLYLAWIPNALPTIPPKLQSGNPLKYKNCC